jgi:hypothetical protein
MSKIHRSKCARKFTSMPIYLLVVLVLPLFAASAVAEEQPHPKPPVPSSMPEPPEAPNQTIMQEGNKTTYHVVSNTVYDENGQEVYLQGGYELITEVTFHPGEEPPPDQEEPKDPLPTPEPIPVTRLEGGLSLAARLHTIGLMQAGRRIYDQESVNCRVRQSGLSAGVIGPSSTVKSYWTLLLYTASYPYYATHQTPGTSTKCASNVVGYCSYQQAFVNRSSIAEPWINHLTGFGSWGYINWAGCW